MKRGGRIARKTRLAPGRGPTRTGRVKPVNPKRRAKNSARAYGPKARRDWIAAQACVVSGETRHIDPAHVTTGGVGRKADARFVIPLAHRLHRELHQHGAKTFEAKYGVDLMALAAETESRWQAQVAAASTIHRSTAA